MYKKHMKRGLDIVISVIAIAVLSWVYLIIFLCVFLASGRPALFTQERPGKDGKAFTLYKFRTMTSEKDSSGILLPDGVRITKIGAFLRKTSLDEIPEFVNILKGDMSLVGPRPLLTCYLDRYSAAQARRHEVRPGLTGFSQVQARNCCSWEERLAGDVWYVDNVSFALDTKIVLKTVFCVLGAKGINSGKEVTMPEFKGEQN